MQISAYLDLMLATLLATGAIAALLKAQMLYTLPVSLFAMSVAAAELPELSRLVQDPQRLAQRTQRGLQQIAFWMLLASFVSIAAGDLIIRVLFEGGKFDSTDAVLVWFVLAAYAVGLPAIGASRLLQNTCYAVGDTRGPARIAGFRVIVSATVALLIMFSLDRVIVGPDGLVTTNGTWISLAPLAESLRAIEGPVRLGARRAGRRFCSRCLGRADAPVGAVPPPSARLTQTNPLALQARGGRCYLVCACWGPQAAARRSSSVCRRSCGGRSRWNQLRDHRLPRIGVRETRLLLDPVRKVFSR